MQKLKSTKLSEIRLQLPFETKLILDLTSKTPTRNFRCFVGVKLMWCLSHLSSSRGKWAINLWRCQMDLLDIQEYYIICSKYRKFSWMFHACEILFDTTDNIHCEKYTEIAENLKRVVWLICAIVSHYLDKMTQKCEKNESFAVFVKESQMLYFSLDSCAIADWNDLSWSLTTGF